MLTLFIKAGIKSSAPASLSREVISEHAENGRISVLFGLSASSGDSLADFSAPKTPRNSARFESKNFHKADFWLCKA